MNVGYTQKLGSALVVGVYQPLVRRTSCGDEKRCHEVLRQPAGASSAELDVFLW